MEGKESSCYLRPPVEDWRGMEGKESGCRFTTSRRRIGEWGWKERKVVANLQPPVEDGGWGWKERKVVANLQPPVED